MTQLLMISALVALTTGIAEVTKRAKWLPKRFIPLEVVVIGIVIAMLAKLSGYDMNWGLTILGGIAFGLSATGLYEFGTKAVNK